MQQQMQMQMQQQSTVNTDQQRNTVYVDLCENEFPVIKRTRGNPTFLTSKSKSRSKEQSRSKAQSKNPTITQCMLLCASSEEESDNNCNKRKRCQASDKSGTNHTQAQLDNPFSEGDEYFSVGNLEAFGNETRVADFFQDPLTGARRIFFGTVVSKDNCKETNQRIHCVKFDDGDEQDYFECELQIATKLYSIFSSSDTNLLSM
jgi:hypothetical protein